MGNFNEKLPKWENTGTEPPSAKKTEGWQTQEKPPAGWLNWLFNRSYKCIEELQEKAITSDDADFVGNQDFEEHKANSGAHGIDGKVGAAVATAKGYTDQVVGGLSGVFDTHQADFVNSRNHLLASDTRNVATTPNDYNGKFEVSFKTTAAIGLTGVGTFAHVVGYRAWLNSSGGSAHEIAFCNNGAIFHRWGLETTWGAWNRLDSIDDIRTISMGGMV